MNKLTKELTGLELEKKKDTKAPNKQNPDCIRVLVVSHGGYIMEIHNIVNFLSKGEKPAYNNTAKNCSLHVFRLEYDGDVGKELDNKKIRIECIVNNDNSHISQ